jgi:hypothetical protein
MLSIPCIMATKKTDLTETDKAQILAGTWKWSAFTRSMSVCPPRNEAAELVRREAMLGHCKRIAKIASAYKLSAAQTDQVANVFRTHCLDRKAPLHAAAIPQIDAAIARLCAHAAKGWR